MSRQVEKIQRGHVVDAFDCGNQELDSFLQQYALQNQRKGISQTYVGLADGTVIGYYTLAYGSVVHEDTPEPIKKGLPQYPIPIMLLARFAVDRHWQKQGVGRALLKDATLRTLQAADIAGIRAVVAHAKNDVARDFYLRFDFLPSPSDPLHLMILLRDLQEITL